MIYLAYAAAWISCSLAVVAGIYITKSPWCLLAFYFVASIKIQRGNISEGDEKNGNDKEINE